MSFLLDGKWVDAPKGSFVLVPGGATHDFENRSETRAGALNFSIPGGFEEHMPSTACGLRSLIAANGPSAKHRMCPISPWPVSPS